MSEAPERSWCVKRLDDNGNEFVLRDGLTRAEAERLVAEYQARGHKQSYWVERVPVL
ncbi:hypothetical protein [Metapseudomonas resinovorans]|uniref:hypothetical protein n=1 Tax=Metapseudomonas resinovorans TaxID=53412 RepID=UPI00040AA0DE|nr:hypothetical protein [Pseudomonas resinovorans]MDE3735864.1 hypothetical protein [Pseudomonas resinovorans]